MADITIVNLNMLYVRYFDTVEREIHLPLGPLYVASALEDAGYTVDFRDYQLCESDDPFSHEAILDFLAEPAKVIGFSCMANLLPFTLLAMKAVKERYPDHTLILAGVGAKSVEQLILERFEWVDLIAVGESERLAPKLLAALKGECPLEEVPGISYRTGGEIRHNPRPERIRELDSITRPAYHHIDLSRYTGFGMITSRGCPYPCTFCSVAPIWDLKSYHRKPEDIVDEIRMLHEQGGAELILFQDEFFVSGRDRVLRFCDALAKSGLEIKYKAFGRINLTDEDMMRAMEETGCVEIRFGIESGSNRILELTEKGFSADQTVEVVRLATSIFRRADLFYVWGFPFETMEDFYQSVFQMVSFRMMGARILPSLLCLLPQTRIYREHVDPEKLEFAPDLFPEYMITGHEISRHAHIEIRPEHAHVFEFIRDNPEIFPGFFHVDLEGNIRPKLRVLQEFGFYPASAEDLAAAEMESCGAHSPKLNESQRQLATRA
ncbi:MAG: B12-binding domain-containing radical SAM protein [Deltaproteobacteria bacterium]|nr:B12-binding domain-containing radical SAM protein [Deltaproteobacteria bacterium]MBW2533087.1 B12-binding domain-containing radical SAM protein [Deltaproteobacteria bacterium]